MSITLSLGPRVRKSPYFEAARKAGLAAASVYNHMYMPTGYGDPAAEYDRLVNGVAMWDVAVERQVALKGPDALALARYLTPRNLDGLAIGQGKYAPICNYEGALINDPVLLQVSDDEIWLSIADSDIKLWAGGIAVALLGELVADTLALIQAGQAGILHSCDVNEHIAALFIGVNETIPFLGVKTFHSAL